MSPLSVHFDGNEEAPTSLGTWHYVAGFASLIPLAGLVPACFSIIWGIMKIEKTGGKVLLLLGILGFGVTGLLASRYYGQVFQSRLQSPPVVSEAASGGGGQITWLQPSDGLRESQRTGKPILYDFTAHWCGFCKLMDKNVFQVPQDASKINALYVPVVVMDVRREEGRNPQDISDLQAKYRVGGYPTLVVQYPDNGASRELVGFQGEPNVMGFLTQGH